MSKQTQVRLETTGHRSTVTFFTEAGLNVMSSAVLDSLSAAVNRLAGNADVWSVVFRAEGKAFLAGADIKQMSGFDASSALEFSKKGNAVMDRIAGLDAITVAAIQGPALGGGCELALACDFRIAVKDARIGVPETTLGLIPGWGGTKRLPQIVGPALARRLIFSGVALEAEVAAKVGLVNIVVDGAAQLDAAVDAWLKEFAGGGPRAIGLAKRATRTGEESAAFADCFTAAESREGMTAFIEKRSPGWTEERR